jgi:hypothetical protein
MTDFCVDCGYEFDISELDGEGRCEYCEWMNKFLPHEDTTEDNWPKPSNEKEDYYF